MIAAEIGKFLDTLELGAFDDEGSTGNIFIEHLPDQPLNAIALYSSASGGSDSKLNYDHVAVQVFIRGDKDPRNAQALAQDIYNELHGFDGGYFIQGGSYIVSCLGLQSQPILLGKNAEGNYEYSLNFEIEFQNKSRRR